MTKQYPQYFTITMIAPDNASCVAPVVLSYKYHSPYGPMEPIQKKEYMDEFSELGSYLE